MNRTRRPAGVGALRRDAGATAARVPQADDSAAVIEKDEAKLPYRVPIMVAMAVAAWGLFIGAGLLLVKIIEAAGQR